MMPIPNAHLVRIKTISSERVKHTQHCHAVTNKAQLFGAIHEHLFAKISWQMKQTENGRVNYISGQLPDKLMAHVNVRKVSVMRNGCQLNTTEPFPAQPRLFICRDTIRSHITAKRTQSDQEQIYDLVTCLL